MSIEAQLKKDLNKADWSIIEPHLKRDAVVVVDQDLDLIAVAKAVVLDEAETMKSWMKDGLVSKPSEAQKSLWKDSSKKFIFLILQPFVLIQEISN